MKYVKVNAYEVGLVFKNDRYVRSLSEGNYWISLFEKVVKYDTTEAFVSPCNREILLEDSTLNKMLEVINVKDDELVLHFENEVFRNVLNAGTYVFWKSIVKNTFTRVDLNKIEISEDISKSVLFSSVVISYVRLYVVESYEKGLLFIDGKFEKELDAGTYFWWKNNISIHVAKVDTRAMQMEISGQEILTKDKAGVRLNFQVKFKVTDIKVALLENKEFEKQLYTLMQLALREYVGAYTLDELLDKKDDIASHIFDSVIAKSQNLGVEILDGGIKDIILPGDMKDIMNQVLIAEKKAQANIIMRREETASTRSLLNTAKLMEDNEMLFKLKEMEYVEKIAEKINTISLSGGGQVIDQLKNLFVSEKKVK
jgi:hypothetical protein